MAKDDGRALTGTGSRASVEPASSLAPTGFDPARMCLDDSEHGMCLCVVSHAREIMRYWTGTNCTWVDDDITALGILAGRAIAAGLHEDAPIPKSLIACINVHSPDGSPKGGDAKQAPSSDDSGNKLHKSTGSED